MITLYPLAAATRPIPMPVFPLVGSIRVSPGLIRPFSSASIIISRPTLSFTDPAGLRLSSFANMFAFSAPAFAAKEAASRMGVLPISSAALFTIFFIFVFPFSISCYSLLSLSRFFLIHISVPLSGRCRPDKRKSGTPLICPASMPIHKKAGTLVYLLYIASI